MVIDFSQFVVQEAAEEFDIPLLRVNGEGLTVARSHLIVVRDGLCVGLKHAQEDQE